jgi:hypothetical protein
MRELPILLLLLAGSLVVVGACAAKGAGPGEGCDNVESRSECQSGFICATPRGGKGALTCQQECTLDTNCTSVEHCEMIGSGGGFKICRPQ